VNRKELIEDEDEEEGRGGGGVFGGLEP